MHLVFKLDKKYDKEMLLEFMPQGGIRNREAFLELMRIDTVGFREVLKGKKIDTKKAIDELVEDKYRKIKPFIKNSINDYQKSWDRINDKFFQLVRDKTGADWKYEKYYCVVSAYHEGISSWGGNTVARRWSVNADVQRRITAHELTLSHFWTMLNRDDTAKKWDDEKKWRYGEIFSWCLLGLDPSFRIFWPWILERDLFPENHNYPRLIPLQKELKRLYSRCDNFPDFFQKAIKKSVSI